MTRQKIHTTGSAELNSLRRITLACLIVCLFAVLGLGRAAASTTQSVQQQVGANKAADDEKDVRLLEPGKPIEREIAGGQNHLYQITLTEGQYLKVIVEQRGINVAVQLMGSDRKLIFEFDDEIRKHGEEMASLVAESLGIYRLSVQTKQNDSSTGRYAIKVVEFRTATEQDITLQETRRLNTESVRLWRAGAYNEAFPLAERALEMREKLLGPAHPNVAQSLNNLANLYLAREDLAKTEMLYRRALEIREKALGPDHPDVAGSLNNLANIYRMKGDYAKAELLYQRALEIREKVLGPDHPDVANPLNNLAIVYSVKGEYAKAEPLYRRALEIREKALGPNHPDVARSLNNLATIYRDRNDNARAEPLYQRALGIVEKVLGPDHPDAATFTNNLAEIYWKRGDYEKAETLYQRVLEIREKPFGPDHPDVASSIHNLAVLYWERGDYTKAEPFFQRALQIRERSLGPNHRDVAHSLNGLAALYWEMGDDKKAEPLYQRALEISEKALGSDDPAVAQSLYNLALLYRTRGDYAKAELLNQRALMISEKALGAEHPEVAGSLHSLGALYWLKGDYTKAEPLFQRALTIREKSPTPGHPDVASFLSSMALLYAAKGEQAQAVATQLRANAVSEHNIIRNLAAGSERQKLAYLDLLSKQSNQSLSLHVQSAPTDPRAVRMALTTLFQRKGRSLDAMSNTFAQLRRHTNAQDQALFAQLTETVSQIANVTFKGPDSKNPVAYREQLKQLEEQKEKIEAELSQRSDEFREQTKPITLESIQAAIPIGSALIEIGAYAPVDVKLGKRGNPRYVAYILLPHGDPRWVDLGEAEPIDQAVAEFRNTLHSSKSTNVKALARRLDEKVMRPVRKLLGQMRNVLLSPDGSLNLVPFAALVDEQNRYLVERYSFTYLTSGRDLLRFRPDAQIAKAPVIVADPDFGERPSDRKTASSTGILDLRQAYFSPLSGTAEEAKALKMILPQATVLTRDQATEAALKQVASPGVLHIATHGFFLADAVENPSEAERRRKLLQHTGGLASLGARLENPLLRSGLGLSGANLRRSGPNQEDDGILTAMEVAGLNLWGTKLVVLSACETGVGEVRTGEGVYGLRRALVLAGAETQVMSLWPVSDRGTRDLMIGYYKALQAGQGRSEAMRQVQLRMLKDPRRRHPFYWASFIVSGEWANLDGKR